MLAFVGKVVGGMGGGLRVVNLAGLAIDFFDGE